MGQGRRMVQRPQATTRGSATRDYPLGGLLLKSKPGRTSLICKTLGAGLAVEFAGPRGKRKLGGGVQLIQKAGKKVFPFPRGLRLPVCLCPLRSLPLPLPLTPLSVRLPLPPDHGVSTCH